MTREVIYINYNNTIEIQLLEDGEALSVDRVREITKVAINYKGTAFDSDTHQTVFDWTTRESEAVVTISPKDLEITTPGKDLTAWLITYDADHPDGFIWGSFQLQAIQVS